MANTLIEKVSSVGGLLIEIWTEDLKHAIDGHPEVTIEKIVDALKNPSKIVQSKNSGNVCLFYSVENKINAIESVFFCVVVALSKPGHGKMITAYEADFIKNGKELYSKK